MGFCLSLESIPSKRVKQKPLGSNGADFSSILLEIFGNIHHMTVLYFRSEYIGLSLIPVVAVCQTKFDTFATVSWYPDGRPCI